MEWIYYPENKPEIPGAYVVSVSKPYANSELTFKYVAYYSVENDSWFKYDPFQEDKKNIQEEISNEVIGWLKGISHLLR